MAPLLDLFPSTPAFENPNNHCKLLVVGAGGIGCELLKALALCGFLDITLIDLDTIDPSNLHRQFLFQPEDVSKSKALTAAAALSSKYPHMKVEAHFGNICDTQSFPLSWFGRFRVILNGLDNLEARRHVNLMAVMNKVPVIETGTAGMLGQSRLIIPDVCECFDCREHAVPTTFPICTIHSSPSTPVHCVVWAKEHLLPALFSSKCEDSASLLDGIKDESIKENFKREQNTFQSLKNIVNLQEQGQRGLETIFGSEITRLAALKEVWEAANRASPTPIALQVGEEWQALFIESLVTLRGRDTVEFDKDDEPVMNFIAAAANLRALCFGIPTKSVFELKAIAGNIIPAISTTNALAATFAVQHLLDYLTSTANIADNCNTIYISNTDKLTSFEKGSSPNPSCSVCGTHRIKLNAPLATTPLQVLLDFVQERSADFGVEDDDDLQVRIGSRIVYDAYELAGNASKTLSALGIKSDSIFQMDTGNLAIIIIIKEDEKVELKILKLLPSQNKRLKTETIENTVSNHEEQEVVIDDDSDLEIL